MSKECFKVGFGKYLSQRKKRIIDEANVSSLWESDNINEDSEKLKKFEYFLGYNSLIDIESINEQFINGNYPESIMRESYRKAIDEAAHLYMLENSENVTLSNTDREFMVDNFISKLNNKTLENEISKVELEEGYTGKELKVVLSNMKLKIEKLAIELDDIYIGVDNSFGQHKEISSSLHSAGFELGKSIEDINEALSEISDWDGLPEKT